MAKKIETTAVTLTNMFTRKQQTLDVVKSKSDLPKNARYIDDFWADTFAEVGQNTVYNVYRTPAGTTYAAKQKW